MRVWAFASQDRDVSIANITVWMIIQMNKPDPTIPRMFDTHQIGEVLIVALIGDGFSSRFADIQISTNQIRRTLKQPDIKHVVIDLGRLEYFGSEVIGAIVSFARDISNRGGNAAMCSASSPMRQRLHDMSLFKLWPHFETCDEAVQSVTQDSD